MTDQSRLPFIFYFTVILLSIFLLSYLRFGPSPVLAKTASSTSSATACPRILWTYHPTPPTAQQRLCLETWRVHHPEPDWTIRVLTPTTVWGYVQGLPRPDTEAPLLRDPDRWEEAIALHVLYEHGGWWLHPSTYLRQPLSRWFPETGKKEVVAFRYTAPPLDKGIVLDKRAMACQRRIPFLRDWRDEYMRLLGFSSTEAYLKSISTETPLSTFTFPVDWTMTLALQHALLKRPYPMESIQFHSVEAGPLRHEQEKKGASLALRPDSQEPMVFLPSL